MNQSTPDPDHLALFDRREQIPVSTNNHLVNADESLLAYAREFAKNRTSVAQPRLTDEERAIIRRAIARRPTPSS